MKKKISKKRTEERNALLAITKKRRLILALSTLPPTLATVCYIVLFALKVKIVWLPAVTSVLWAVLGCLFVYSSRSRWGNVNKKGVVSEESDSIATVYNTVLVFLLCLLFAAFTVMEII